MEGRFSACAWSIVIARLDGEPGVDVEASMGLRFGFLVPVGVVALIAGALAFASAFLPPRRDERGLA